MSKWYAVIGPAFLLLGAMNLFGRQWLLGAGWTALGVCHVVMWFYYRKRERNSDG